LVGITTLSITASQPFWQPLADTSPPPGPAELLRAVSVQLARLQTSPPLGAPMGISSRVPPMARYLAECTGPDDRLLTTWFAPEFYFYSGRALAGRQLFWYPGYASSEVDQLRTIEKLRTQSVPVIVNRPDRLEAVVSFPLVQRYIDEHYRLAPQTVSRLDPTAIYEVYVDQRRTPARTYEPLGLPCYRA
jgi:hypothetical protein